MKTVLFVMFPHFGFDLQCKNRSYAKKKKMARGFISAGAEYGYISWTTHDESNRILQWQTYCI